MSPNQRNKIKNKLLPLARHVIYILSYDQDSSSFSTSSFDLPLIFLSLFFFSPSPFTFLISSSNFFFPYPCVIIFLSPLGRKYPLPTSFPLQIQSVAGVYKHRRNLFPSLFTHFWTFLHISYTRERRGGEKIAGKGVGNENVRPLTLNRAVSVSAYF